MYPQNFPPTALACQRCARRKARCSHVGPSASAAPSTNVAEWQVAVREGVAMVADAMDRQTEVLGELASEMYGLRQAVERLSSSSASSLRGAASGDTGPESAWDKDEEVREDEEMWMDDERVELQVRGEGEESSDTEEEEDDEGGKHDEERERDGDDEEEGGDDEGGAEPEASTTPWRPRVPRPRMKAWKGKGKATEKGKGKEKMY